MDLPLELKNEILRLIPVKEYPKIALACRALRSDLKHEYLWKFIFNRKGVKTYRNSYLESTKTYLERRWKWESSDECSTERKTVSSKVIKGNKDVFRDLSSDYQTKQAMTETQSYLKIIIEKVPDYFYIGLEEKKGEEKTKRYALSYSYKQLGTFIQYKTVAPPVNILRDGYGLKKGDMIEINLVDNEPIFKLNAVEIPIIIHESLRVKLKEDKTKMYPTVVLYGDGCVRIINE